MRTAISERGKGNSSFRQPMAMASTLLRPGDTSKPLGQTCHPILLLGRELRGEVEVRNAEYGSVVAEQSRCERAGQKGIGLGVTSAAGLRA